MVLAVLLLPAGAWAKPATVQLRVEGATSTIFEGPVTTDGHSIDKGGGAHPCDGTNGGAHPFAVPTMTSALDDGAAANGFSWDGTWFSFGDFGVDRIGSDTNDFAGNRFWGYALNFVPAAVGGCQQQVADGDEVLFAFDFFASPPPHLLRLAGPARAALNAPVTVRVSDGQNGSPVAGASIAGVPGAVSGTDGSATVSFDSPGIRRLKAQAPGSIRSNSLLVCASQTGSDDCGVPPSTLGAPGSRGGVRDSRAPVARISGPRDGGRYRRGPRLLRGSATDDASGVDVVKLALRRHFKGRCSWWSGRRERFVGRGCRKKFFFAVGSDADWSYLLPQRLPAGRYVLDVKAFDRARNRTERFRRGVNRVVFHVAPARARTRAARVGKGARIQVMVVGRDRVIADPRQVRASATHVRVGGRRCRVSGSTPLAGLVRALAGTRIRYHLHDYGSCSRRSAADAGQLFVDRVGGDANRGQDGWFYKVNGRAGSGGAADLDGPFGHGRLRQGDRLLWFFCRFDVRAGSCQRSLVASAAARGLPGERLRVKVAGEDNERRARPVGGVTVTLGPASALTDSHGLAELVLPSPGRYELRAQSEGTLPSFPRTVTVLEGTL